MINYEISTDKVVKRIRKEHARLVCLQFPEGIKKHATRICDELREKTGAEITIWGGTNYGACDTPLYLDKLGINLLVHFGHNKFPI